MEIENIRKDIRMRFETDSMMSTAWILAYVTPIILVVGWIAVFFVALISVIMTLPATPLPSQPTDFAQFSPVIALIPLLYLIAIVGIVVNVILMYKFVRRRNTHFRRQMFLFEDILSFVRTTAVKKRVDVEVSSAAMDRTFREVRTEENEKNAVLWALLSVFIPLLSWYVYYFLMKDFYKHERREDELWEDFGRTLDKLGVPFSMPRRTEPVPERSFVLYLIVSIITLGIFGIYWIYVLLKDPNNHFGYHMKVEDPLLSTLEAAHGTV